jgi:flagellar hook assembly protein FlgD
MSPDVDLAAPGTGIIATIFNGNVGSKQGTSMATPNAAGVAALALSKYPNATPGQLEWLLKSTATDLGAAGRDNSFGFGLVHAANALNGTLDTTGPVITNVTRSRAIFSGNVVSGMIVNQVTLGYTLNEKAFVTAEIQNSLGVVVRVIENAVLKNAGTYSTLVWDGKNTAKQYVPTGNYSFVVKGVDMAENQGSPESISIIFDRQGPVTTFDDLEPEPQNNYSPMNYLTDSKKSYFTVADAHDTSFVMSSTNTTVSVINASGVAVRTGLTMTNEGVAYSVTWNGRTNAGGTVPDGPYRFSVRSTDTYGNVGVTNSTSFQIQGRNPTITVSSSSGIVPKPFKAAANGSKQMTLTYVLSEPATNVSISFTDQFGSPVFTANYSTGRPIGTNTVKWNGRSGASVGDSPSAGGTVVTTGTYNYMITMSDADSISVTRTGSFQLTR